MATGYWPALFIDKYFLGIIFMEKDEFVSLPPYEKLKSYKILKHGDFKKNYLLYISCFQLGKHLKTIQKRIIKNFENGVYLEESFQMLEEICGFDNKNIFNLGTLFDIFSKIDYLKYEKKIFYIFYLQLFFGKFNKKKKYAKAYELYKIFNVNLLQFDKDDFEKLRLDEKSLEYLFYKTLVYYYAKQNIERVFRIDSLISVLDKDSLSDLKTDLDYSCEEFYKLTENSDTHS